MLTVKQEKFCNLYVELGNASEAYRSAYSCDNMKDESINVQSSKLLNNPKITLRVKELQEQLQKRSDMSKDEAVSILENIVRVNPLDYVEIGQDTTISNSEGNISKSTKQTVIVKDLSCLTVEQQRCIKSITPTRDGVKIEFESKTSAIDRLSKMMGWDAPTQVNEARSIIVNVKDKETEELLKKL